jgi:hypothetical protein
LTPYKLFFLDDRNKIKAAEDVDGSSDAQVCEHASARLALSAHAAVEVWNGARKIIVLQKSGPKGNRFACVNRLIGWLRA